MEYDGVYLITTRSIWILHPSANNDDLVEPRKRLYDPKHPNSPWSYIPSWNILSNGTKGLRNLSRR
jgi:hypothetical protein